MSSQSQHEQGEHAPQGPSPETARAQEIARTVQAGERVSVKDVVWVAQNYPEFLPPQNVPSAASPYTLTPHERYEASAIGTEQAERTAYTRRKEEEESITFYQGIGHPEYGGKYPSFKVPSGYAVKNITKTSGGLSVAFGPTPELEAAWKGVGGQAVSAQPLFQVATLFVAPYLAPLILAPELGVTTASLLAAGAMGIGASEIASLAITGKPAPIEQALQFGLLGESFILLPATVEQVGRARAEVQRSASGWLTKKAIERGSLESASLSERIVSRVTGAEPHLPYGAVDVPEEALAVPARGLPKMDVKQMPEDYLGGYDVTSASEVERQAGKAAFGRPQDLAGFGISEKEFASLSLEEKIAYRALTPKDVPVERMPSDFLAGKHVKDLAGHSGSLSETVTSKFGVSIAPKTSGILIGKMPGDTLAKEWAMERLFKTAYGGIAYSSVQEILAKQPSKMPYVPEVSSTEELSELAFIPIPMLGGQVQAQVPKAKSREPSAIPFIPKVEPISEQRERHKPMPIMDISLTSDVSPILDIVQTSMQKQTPTQEQSQIAETTTANILNVTSHARTTPMPFKYRGSDELLRSKKRRRVGGFLDYGQVFRGWPVRKPAQLLKANRSIGRVGVELGKPSTKRLKAQISDERRSSRMYRGWGFRGIAKDETRHRRALEKELRKRQKK